MAKERSPKFKQTKQLIAIALNDGMTQDEIARLCRVNQSTVSKWKSGASVAREDQLDALIKKYGHLLRRAPFKLYAASANKDGQTKFIKVEGKVILREIFAAFPVDTQTSIATPAAIRCTLHEKAKGHFALMFEMTRNPPPAQPRQGNLGNVDYRHRHAIWHCFKMTKKDIGLQDLVAHAGELSNNPPHADNGKHIYKGVARLSFLIRDALLHHNYDLDDVDLISARN